MSQVCNATGKGGGATDGNTGRRFFSGEIIETIKELTSGDSKVLAMQPDVLLLHRNLCVILRY